MRPGLQRRPAGGGQARSHIASHKCRSFSSLVSHVCLNLVGGACHDGSKCVEREEGVCIFSFAVKASRSLASHSFDGSGLRRPLVNSGTELCLHWHPPGMFPVVLVCLYRCPQGIRSSHPPLQHDARKQSDLGALCAMRTRLDEIMK